jgi:alpha-L-fucosidase 2
VQLDANMGLVSAVQEMLLFASENTIRILPALPTDWHTGSVERIRFHAGAVDLEWDRHKQTFAARLEAERAAAFALDLPSWLDAYNLESDGEAAVSADDRHRLNVKLAAGQQLRITAIEKETAGI